jgi:hypothetical protein
MQRLYRKNLGAVKLFQLPAQIAGRERQAEKIHAVRYAEIIDLVAADPFLVDKVQLLDLVSLIAPLQKGRHDDIPAEFYQNLYGFIYFFMHIS